MRRLYLIICLLGFSTFMFGQTYLSEDFSGTMPPADWTINGLPAQWSISNSSNAGGTAPEAMFTWIQQTATTHLISPEIDLTGLTTVNLTFRHFYDDYSGAGPLAGVATRSGSGSWNSIWEINPGSNVGPQELTFEIDNGDVGASDFQIAFYLNGNMYNIDYWYIDDVWLYLPLNLDASMSAISTPGYVNGPTEVMGTVKNLGSDQITSLDISWQIDEGDVYSTSFTGLGINFGATYDFTCDDMFELPIGGYDLKVWIVNVNGSPDQDPTNDMLMKPVSVVSYTVPKIPCFEEFTSSTCPPCATFNAQFVPWCEQHAEDITLIKYQMNWPGSGDPYYTAEGGVRRNWYGVTWVPWLVGEGEFVNTNIGAVQAKYDEAMAQPGLLDIASTHSLNGTVMSITTNILPFADFTNFKVVINVFEWLTTENATTNGETEFENVMMKMVPDANGTNTDLMDRMPFTIQETVDLNGTFVEEWDDLGVMVIVQDNADKVVYQSAYSLEDMTYATDATLSMITYDGMEVPDFSPDVFEYTVVLPMGTVEVPAVAAMLNDENGIAIVIPSQELPGATTVDVFAEDRATKNTYTINFEVNTTGIEPEITKAVSVYPNPTNGKVFISGAENATVEIYNLTGAKVASYTDFSSNVIDLSAMEEGIYFLNIVIDNKTVLNKKISLLK